MQVDAGGAPVGGHGLHGRSLCRVLAGGVEDGVGQDAQVRAGHLVVREQQVHAAALDVERGTEAVGADEGALDVPAGAAGAEVAAVPRGLPRAFTAPQERVEGVALPGPVGVAASLGEQREHRVPVQAGDGPEGVVDGQVGVHVAEVGPVSPGLVLERHPVRRARGHELAHGADDVGHGLHGADVHVGRDDAEGGHVLREQSGLGGCQLTPVDAGRGRALEERVVDVGHVGRVGDLLPGVAPGPLEQVERHVGGGVTEVGRIVGRDAAHVHAGVRPRGGHDELTGAGVVDPDLRRAVGAGVRA